MSAEAIADMEERRQRELEHSNAAARKLMSETEGAMKHRVEDVLGVDGRRMLKLAMDLIDSLNRLRSAHDTYELLRRREL